MHLPTTTPSIHALGQGGTWGPFRAGASAGTQTLEAALRVESPPALDEVGA
jgi:hypothetical protein